MRPAVEPSCPHEQKPRPAHVQRRGLGFIGFRATSRAMSMALGLTVCSLPGFGKSWILAWGIRAEGEIERERGTKWPKPGAQRPSDLAFRV